MLNAYSENNQTPSNNVKQSLNYTNAIDKLSMENFEDIKGQLKDFQINTSKEVNIFVDSIFHRILMNPEIDVIGAELCKELYVKSTISIQSLICEKVVNLVEVHSNTVKNYLKFLRSHQNDLMTDTRICGFTKFIAEFFKVDLLPVAYVHMHLQRLLDLNYICEPLAYLASVLLLSCGAELYNSKLKRGVLKSFVGYLETFCQKTKTDTVVRRNFLKISKLQQNNWQVVEKASTTISHGTIKAQTKVPRCSKVKSTKNKTDYEIKIQSIMINLLSDPSSISKFVKDVANMNDHLFKNLLISECKKKLEKYEETMKLYKGQKLLELISKIQTEVDSHKRKELKGILDCLLDAPKDTARIVQFITEVVISGLRDLI